MEGDRLEMPTQKRKGNEAPLINPSFWGQPHDAIGFSKIVMIKRAAPRRIYWQDKPSQKVPQSECSVLFEMIALPGPKIFRWVRFVTRSHENNIPNTACGIVIQSYRIKVIGVNYERWVYRHRRTLAISGESHLDRVQFNVATLEGEESQESNRQNAEQREVNLHLYHLAIHNTLYN
jgi:hypothetical protein